MILPLYIAMTAPAGDIDRYLQPQLQDLSFEDKVVRSDQRELAKINEDFGASYRFSSTTIRIKEPFKLRIDAKVEDTNVSYLLDGPIQVLSVPRARLHQRTDLTGKPGRRQTAFDFGVLTPSLFDNFYQAKFVRLDRATGDPVFDVTYVPQLGDKSHSRLWIDPVHHVIARREWYRQNGDEEAIFTYSDPVEDNGVWMPTKLEVRNTDNQVAGVTRYEQIKVNQGIADSVFR